MRLIADNVACQIDSVFFSEIRPYMYETLMCLVGVHARVCSTAESLLDRTLNALVEEIASEALRCIRQVKRFGMGGMLCVSKFISYFVLSVRLTTLPLPVRRPWKSNSCTKPLVAMLVPQRRRHYPIYTIESHRHIPVVQVMRVSRQT